MYYFFFFTTCCTRFCSLRVYGFKPDHSAWNSQLISGRGQVFFCEKSIVPVVLCLQVGSFDIKRPIDFCYSSCLVYTAFSRILFCSRLATVSLRIFLSPSSTLFPQPEMQELWCRHMHWSRLPRIPWSLHCVRFLFSFGEIWWPHLHEDVRIRFRMWEGLCWSDKMSVIDSFLRSVTSLALGRWQFLVATNMWMPLLALLCHVVLVVVHRCCS